MAGTALGARIRRVMRAVRDERKARGGPERRVGPPSLERWADDDGAATFAPARGWLAYGDEAANLTMLLGRVP